MLDIFLHADTSASRYTIPLTDAMDMLLSYIIPDRFSFFTDSIAYIGFGGDAHNTSAQVGIYAWSIIQLDQRIWSFAIL